MIRDGHLSKEYILHLLKSKNDEVIMDVVIELLRLKDLSGYKEIIDAIVQYVYDFMHVSNYERLIYFSEPLKRLLKHPTSPMSDDDYYDFATLICYIVDDFDSALYYFDEYYEKVIKNNDSRLYYSSLINYAITNMKLEKFEEARKIIDDLMERIKDKDDESLWFVARLTHAELLMHEDKLDDVPVLLQESLESSMLESVVNNQISLYVLFSKYYEKIQEVDSAMEWYRKAIDLIEQHQVEYAEKTVYKDFARLLKQYGRYSESAQHYEKFVDLTEEAIAKNRNLMRIKSELEIYIKEKDDEAYHLIRENERMKNENRKDFLTGIYNRRYLYEYIDRSMKNKRCSDLVLFVFDIDDFKVVNDSYGHLTGDFVIKEICRIISEVIDEDQIFARTGGDEFMLCFDGVAFDEVVQLCDRLIGLVKGAPMEYDEEVFNVSISGGLAACNEEEVFTRKDLIALADLHLYEAKNKGKNRVEA